VGNHETKAELQPTILPELQNSNKGVTSVILGDYHFSALTATGKLFTWGINSIIMTIYIVLIITAGQYSNGALGLGNPADIKPGQLGGFLTQGHHQIALIVFCKHNKIELGGQNNGQNLIV